MAASDPILKPSAVVSLTDGVMTIGCEVLEEAPVTPTLVPFCSFLAVVMKGRELGATGVKCVVATSSLPRSQALD